MHVPFEWLKEFVDITATPEEVADRLTMLGFEVEAMESRYYQDDTVFEINVTPNRPDCLSILGIAREVSVAFKVPLKTPLCEIKERLPFSDFSVEILDPELCNRYAGRVIKGVRVSESPEWIKTRLEKCGIRVINNVVDITNYVLLEFGHPLHAFDADTLEGKKIRVGTPDTVIPPHPPLEKGGVGGFELKTQNSKLKTQIRTLDGVDREIMGGSLLIWDAENPVAIAGVMGGLETEVSNSTVNVFLESAYFEPSSIRRTSKRLNLISESSYRFERGADIELLEKALNRAALMIREITGGTIHEIIDVYPVKYVPESIEIKYERINKILGTDLSKTDMIEILKRLDIIIEDGGDFFIVYPPAHRRDIKQDSDVAEEVARSYGYNKIPSKIPRSPLSSGRLNKKMMNINKIREAMRRSGFTEVINYSFMSPLSLDMIAIPEDDRRRNVIVINNPLRQDESLLRTTLIPALIENLKYNLDRGIRDIRLFEISGVFEDIGKPLPLEELRLGGIFYRDKIPSLWKDDTPGFFITKGIIESMFEELKINEYSFSSSPEPFLHKGQACDIYIIGSYVGYLGVFGPEIIERLDLKKHRPEIVVFELNLDLLLTLIPETIKYSEIPKHPYVERDIAIVIGEDFPTSKIKAIIRIFPSEFIEEISVFDYYKGINIPKGKKSLAFNIRYRAKDRTLTDDEVDELHASVVEYILEKTGGELRK